MYPHPLSICYCTIIYLFHTLILFCIRFISETLPSLGYVGYYEYGGNQMHQKHFQCRGIEEDLSQCAVYNLSSYTHTSDAAVTCSGRYYMD